jgi:hypothetical protein
MFMEEEDDGEREDAKITCWNVWGRVLRFGKELGKSLAVRTTVKAVAIDNSMARASYIGRITDEG